MNHCRQVFNILPPLPLSAPGLPGAEEASMLCFHCRVDPSKCMTPNSRELNLLKLSQDKSLFLHIFSSVSGDRGDQFACIYLLSAQCKHEYPPVDVCRVIFSPKLFFKFPLTLTRPSLVALVKVSIVGL